MYRSWLCCLLLLAQPALAQSPPCGFRPAFKRADERQPRLRQVHEDRAAATNRPLIFLDLLKVNTDGTRRSYHRDDPRGESQAINSILNAMPRGATYADYDALKRNGFRPVSAKGRLTQDVIEHTQAGSPCIAADGYFVSMTAVPSRAGAFNAVGDCDQDKWLDALRVPALVLPSPDCRGCSTEFDQRGATKRNFVVAMAIGSERLAYGIVGDKGPTDQLGEASVAMNRKLNGLPEAEMPRNYQDAKDRFQAPRSIVLIFPGQAARAQYPITAATVAAAVEPVFQAWGGVRRLQACAAELN